MAFPQNDLEQRIALMRPGDTVRGLSFTSVLKLARARLGNDAAERLREPLMKRNPVDFFSYPVVDFLRMLSLAADLLEPEFGSKEAALWACGKSVVDTFLESTVGQTLLRITAGSDPKRVYSNATTAYATTVSYGHREFSVLGDKSVRLYFKGDPLPHQVHEGILGGGLSAIKREGRVRGTELSLGETEYIVEWL
jgi:uncharacterized protein (TIGR02265 family)